MKFDQEPVPDLSMGVQFALRLREIVLDYDFEFAELLCGTAATGWGLWVWLPWWDAYQTTTTFHVLEQLAPEWVIGFTAMVLGAAQLVALLADHRFCRKQLAFISFIGWSFITVLLFLASHQSPVWIVHGCLALAAAWGFLRIVADRRRGPRG